MEFLFRPEFDRTDVERRAHQGDRRLAVYDDHAPRLPERGRCRLAPPGSLDGPLGIVGGLGPHFACRHGQEHEKVQEEESGHDQLSGSVSGGEDCDASHTKDAPVAPGIRARSNPAPPVIIATAMTTLMMERAN